MAKFRKGQKVILLPNKEEGWPKEEGIILEQIDPVSYLVEVSKKYRSDEYDDGLRDGVPEEYMKAATSKKRKTKKKKNTGKRRRR